MPMNCKGCNDSKHCNCSIEVLRENEFNFFILLDTFEGPKWCPSSTIDSMYFNCEPDNFMKILASQVCDGFGDCPRRQDESEILCRSIFLKMLILAVVMTVYGLALTLAICYSCKTSGREKKTDCKQTIKKRNTQRKVQVMKDLHSFSEDCQKLRRSQTKKVSQGMSKATQIELLLAANHIPTRDQKGTLLKSAVQNIIQQEGSNPELMLTAVKNLPISDGLKNRIFSTYAQGSMTKMKHSIAKRLKNDHKNTLVLLMSITGEIINLILTAMQEVKDLLLIVTLFIFYNEVLQKRPWLIDGINLNDYVSLLVGIYIFTTTLKLLRASNTLNKEENKSISGAVRAIPFFNEIFLSIKIIQEKVEVFKLRRSIDANLDIANNELQNKEEVWGKVLDAANQINRAELKLEKRDQARMRIKICSSIGDILQVSVLTILLLRADLRVRGALINQQMTEAMGGRASDGGTPGKGQYPMAKCI